MARKDGPREGVATCAEVRDRIYPLLLRTLDEHTRLDTLEHAHGCESCRAALHVARGRLGRLEGVPIADIDERRRATLRRRRLALALVLGVFLGVAYAMLLRQGIAMARDRAERRALARITNAILLYREDFGVFPPDDGAPLSVYLAARGGHGPYLDVARERVDFAGHFLDHWGRRYRYKAPGTHNPRLFDLKSLGANGRDDAGAKDDLANWD